MSPPRSPPFAATVRVALALALACGCASIPKGRSAVDDITVRGESKLDEDEITERIATTQSPKFLGIFRGVIYDYALLDRQVLQRDLARVERFRVVERTQMSMLVDELKLAQTTVKVGAPKASAGLMTPRGMKERLAALTRKDGSGPYYTGPIDDTAPGESPVGYSARSKNRRCSCSRNQALPGSRW